MAQPGPPSDVLGLTRLRSKISAILKNEQFILVIFFYFTLSVDAVAVVGLCPATPASSRRPVLKPALVFEKEHII